MKPFHLSPSTKLQLHALLGALIVAVPAVLLATKLPVLRDWPLWVLITIAVLIVVICMVWFRQCMSPDGTSFKPKWR